MPNTSRHTTRRGAGDRDGGLSPFHDFEIRIGKPQADGGHPVWVHVAAEDRRAEAIFRSPFSDAEITRALAWMEQGLFDADFVKEFGAALFDALFVAEVKLVYEGSRANDHTRLRLRLIIDAPTLVRLPWELLYDSDRAVFLALEGPFVRGASLTGPTRPLRVAPPLRLLVVDAFPRGVLKVESQLETGGIRQALAQLERGRRVDVRTLPHATLSALQNALREAADPADPKPIHLLHFIGHGQHDPVSGRTVLLFESEQGEIDEVDPEALLNVLRPYDLKLVFLNACQSLQGSSLDLAEGFAPTLLASGIPTVVGMQATVLDTLAVQFAREFYAALADNAPVDVALADARRLARGSRQRRKADLGIPVCYLRTPNGQLLDIERPAPLRLTSATWRPWLKQRVTPNWLAGTSLALVGLVSGLIGIYQFGQPCLQPLPEMRGDFNVAVARFGALDERGRVTDSATATSLSDSLFEALRDELKQLGAQGSAGDAAYDIPVLGPDQTRRGGCVLPWLATFDPKSLAGQIKADVVVYGHLQPSGAGFAPEFYLTDRSLRNAEELVGQYELGSPIPSLDDVDRNPEARRQLRERLMARARALAQFTIGLSNYTVERFEQASHSFEAAAKTPEWDPHDGKEVLYHFLGNTAGRRHDLNAAAGYYKQALDLEPEYARARLGAAEVLFQRSRADCQPGRTDADGLRRAVEGFQSALAARIQPATSDIQTKTAFGLGRAYLCLSQAQAGDYWDQARVQLQSVVAAHDGGDPDAQRRLKGLAAEAHAGLGLAALPARGDPEAEAKYRAAAAEYRQAIALLVQLNRRRDLQAVYHGWLAFLAMRLQDCRQADDELAAADSTFARALRDDQLPPNPGFERFRASLAQQRTELSC